MKKQKIKESSGGVTAPQGFLSAGINCGLRKSKPDLALIYSTEKCVAVAAFTKNLFRAAPVVVSKENIKNPIQAVIINSGNANACTGKRGINNAQEMCSLTAQYLNIKPENVLVFSTGVIGKYLEMNKIRQGIKILIPLLSKNSHIQSAQAILTTDKVIKEVAVEFKIKNKKVKIGAMAKGSGMIAPDMATMLAFITSDINIEKKLLKKLFKKAIEESFNLISVDGEMSTNDSVVFLTNRMANNPIITEDTSLYSNIFYNNLLYVMQKLAKLIVKDGEGVTKVIEIFVKNAANKRKAKKIAQAVANSPLVKTAIYGEDPNWGRIIASIGGCGEKFLPEKVSLKFGNYTVFRNNTPVKSNEEKLKQYLKNDEIKIVINLNEGNETVKFITGDLTEEYININAKYRT